MHFEADKTYHIYNRSNELVFNNKENYLFFLSKVKQLIYPFTEIMAWCLMPNHFHLLIISKANGCVSVEEKHRPNTQQLSKNIGTLLSSYTKAINKSTGRRGKLFAHNTKAKCLNDQINNDYLFDTCFHYIHQNPVKAGLCKRLEDWQFSSYLDYLGKRNGRLVNKQVAYEMLHFDEENFKEQSEFLIDESKLKELF